jgi:serine/threonine protein kinase
MIASEHRLALPAGYQLGKYRFKGVLGAGGFGITYLADDQSLARRVAIKELLPNDIATRVDGTTVVAKTKSEQSNLIWARERFLEEGRALAACEHPNVVHVYEMIEANGTAYMVTKYEDGHSLAEWLNNLGRPPTEAELRGILDPLLSGLEKVHRAGFLHRDIKPENIYITEDGRPLLLDFGSARQAVSDRSQLMTSIVTIGYAPFEQYYEDGKQGAWSDIYAMSGVMYRAIHGEKPPEATRRLKNDSSVKLAKKYQRDYSLQFLNAIDRGLSVEAQDRPQTVAAWRSMLGKGTAAKTEELIIPPQPVWMERLKHVRELAMAYPRSAASAAGVAVVLTAWGISSAFHPTPKPQPAPLPTPIVVVPTPVPVVKVDPTPTPAPIAVVTTPAPTTPVPATPPGWQTVFNGQLPPGVPPLPPGVSIDQWIKDHQAVAPGTPAPSTPANPALVTMGYDNRLNGTWSTKLALATGFVVLHWEQFADGHYVSSSGGVKIDTGVITAQDGKIHRISANSAFPPADLTYKFEGNHLITIDAVPGAPQVSWTLISKEKEKSSSGSSHTSRSRSSGDSGEETTAHHPSGGDWRQYVPNGWRGRFGF